MALENTPLKGLTDQQLVDVQGDVWSRGFPKDYETYYLFTILEPKQFSSCLPLLVTETAGSPPLISNLKKVRQDRGNIKEQNPPGTTPVPGEAPKPKIILDVSNALIAFTIEGLKKINDGISNRDSLELSDVAESDPAFSGGMHSNDERRILRDPPKDTWDDMFKPSDNIHGLLKIGGSTRETVEKHLGRIKEVLQHGTVIADVLPAGSRMDGWTRPGKERGKEHFGFQDAISQPRMKGIDELETHPPPNMNTEPELLIVTPDTQKEGPIRPQWMKNGSFLVLRKLEQDVKAFQELVAHWAPRTNCRSPAHLSAKLMGRWQSGAPIVTNDSKDLEVAKDESNKFSYTDQTCPFSAHIRKTNPRRKFGPQHSDTRADRARIIRNGIPYGSEYVDHANDGSKRGLLFVCYQGHIEDGFQEIQVSWSNKVTFPNDELGQDPRQEVGHDPIIGQGGFEDDGKTYKKIKTHFTDKDKRPQVIEFPQLVTFKGGGYFFVPSITALKKALAGVPN